MNNRRYGLFGLIFIVWIFLILIFSMQGGTGSHALSTSLTQLLGSVLFPDFSSWSVYTQENWISGMEQLMRKTAHFMEFAVLGLLAYCFIFGVLMTVRRKTATVLACGMTAFCICSVIAVASELVQTVTMGRSATASDVLLDCAGIFLGIFLAWYRNGKSRQRENENRTAVQKHRKG